MIARPAAPDITSLRLAGVRPFPSGGDLADRAIESAFALTTLLSLAYGEAHEMPLERRSAALVNSTSNRILAGALERVAQLLALAQHGLDLDREDERQS